MAKSLASKQYLTTDLSTLDESTPLHQLCSMLPVIYIADIHPDYGTLGYLLSQPSGKTVADFYPSFKFLRKNLVYCGGLQNRGSSFTMLHQKVGFPENRAFKVLPGHNNFKLFFSPDVAMANELVSTNDAQAEDFRFFEMATVWLPNQLDYEYDERLWLTAAGPPEIIFDQRYPYTSLWMRIVRSLDLSVI